MIGSKLGPYELLEEVGRGGMAAVYRAYQTSMDRYVAVKVIYRSVAADSKSLDRFQREARLVAKLEHPHILPVYDYNGLNDPPYIVMRFMPTGTLKDIFAHERLPFHEIAYLLTQVASALDYAHRQGIVHRDIKPSNIMVDGEGNAFLTDFGIARMIEGGGETQGLTGTGMAIGTPGYMAPEQGMGQPIDGRADIYSVGVMLYEMLSGKMPYNAETPMAVILRHINDPLPIITEVNAAVPPAVTAVIQKAMAKKPEDRYATATELARAFNAALGPSEEVSPIRLQAAAAATIQELAATRAEQAKARAKALDEQTIPPTRTPPPGSVLAGATLPLKGTPSSPMPASGAAPMGTQPTIAVSTARGAALGAGVVIILIALVALGALIATTVLSGNARATNDAQTQVALAITSTSGANGTATHSAELTLNAVSTLTASFNAAANTAAANTAAGMTATFSAALNSASANSTASSTALTGIALAQSAQNETATVRAHPTLASTTQAPQVTPIPPTAAVTAVATTADSPVATTQATVTAASTITSSVLIQAITAVTRSPAPHPTTTLTASATASRLPPTATLTRTPTLPPTATPTNTLVPSPVPSFTLPPTYTPAPTYTPYPTFTPPPTHTPPPTATKTPVPPTATNTFTAVPPTFTVVPSATFTAVPPSLTPTRAPTLPPTVPPTAAPVVPSVTPNVPPTATPVATVPLVEAPTAAPPGQLPYVNDMESFDAVRDWDLDPSVWHLLPDSGNTSLVGTGGLQKPAVVLGKANPAPEWTDPNNRTLLLSFSISLDNQSSVGRVIFRDSDAGYYALEMGGGFVKVTRGQSAKVDRPTERQLPGGVVNGASIHSNTFYQWLIWADDNRIYLYLDHKLFLQVKDSASALLPGGAILLQTLSPNYGVRFDNLKVQRPGVVSQHFEGSGWPGTWTRSNVTDATIGDDGQGNHFIEQTAGEVSPNSRPFTDFLMAFRYQSIQGGFDLHVRESPQGYFLFHFAEGSMTLSTVDSAGKAKTIQTFPNFYGRGTFYDFIVEMVGTRVTVYAKDVWSQDIPDGPTRGTARFSIYRKGDSVRLDDFLVAETAKSVTELAQWAFDKIQLVEARPDRELDSEFYDRFVDKFAKKDWWEGGSNAPGDPKSDPKSRDYPSYLEMTYKEGAAYRIFRYIPGPQGFRLFGAGTDKLHFNDSSDLYVRVNVRLPSPGTAWVQSRTKTSVGGGALEGYRLQMTRGADGSLTLEASGISSTGQKTVYYTGPLPAPPATASAEAANWASLLVVVFENKAAFFANGRFLVARENIDILGGTVALGVEQGTVADFNFFQLRDISPDKH